MYEIGSSSYNPETEERYGAEVLESLRSGDINDKEAIKIGNIGEELHQKLSQLGKENIFTEKDQERWKMEIAKIKRQKPKDFNALKQVSDKIDQERNEIQKMTQTYVAKMEQNSEAFSKDSKRGLDSIKEYLKEFLELNREEKIKRFDNLQKDIDDRFDTIEAILKLDPDMKQHLKTMRRSERETKLKELEKLVNKDLKSHEDLITEYGALPDKFRNVSRSEFRKLTLQAKDEKMKEMVKTMEKDFEKMLKKAGENKTKSAKDIEEARDYFFSNGTPLLGKYGKIKAWESFDKQLKEDLILVKNFKEGIEEFPANNNLFDGKEPDTKLKNVREKLEKDFEKGSYTERAAIIEKMEGIINEMHYSYHQKYLETLQGYQEQGIISMKTLREYSVWYMLQPLKDKPKFIHGDLPKDMANRKNTMRSFNQALVYLSPDKAMEYRARFFDQQIGGSAREQILTEILSLIKMKKEDLLPANDNDISLEDTSNPSMPQKNEAANDNASLDLENASDAELQKMVDDAKQAETILQKRKLITSLNLMAEAANDNALRNSYQTVASKRTYGLNEEQQELQEKMNAQANGAESMVLVDDPVKGGKVAQKVTRLDVKKMHEKSHEDVYALEKEATRIQQTTKDKRANLGQSIEFMNEAGQAISQRQGLEQVESEEAKLAKEIAKTAAQREQSKGRGLSENKKKQLEKFAQKQDLTIKLEADYSKR